MKFKTLLWKKYILCFIDIQINFTECLLVDLTNMYLNPIKIGLGFIKLLKKYNFNVFKAQLNRSMDKSLQ
jgi:hypothetical protein